jgi:DNA-directed RNA polymerase subunit beta
MIFLTAEQEMKFNIGSGDINLKDIKEKKIYAKKNQYFKVITKKNLNILSPYQNQILSTGTNLIPFLEHNDANRSLMGSNMQRQALTLLKRETPLIETGIEKYIAKESQLSLETKESGKIIYNSSEKIILKYPIYKTKFKRKLIQRKKLIKIMKNCKWKNKIYFIESTRKSNQNNHIKQIVNVKNNEWVKKGHILAGGKGILNNKLAIGKNILVGYMGWEGYNFEDAIVISERLVNEDVFTSTHIKRYKTFIINNDKEEVRTKT